MPKLIVVSGDWSDYVGGLRQTFSNCSNLISAEFPNLSAVYEGSLYGTFDRCYKLSSISFPALSTLQFREFQNAFTHCGTNYYTAKLTIEFPVLQQIGYESMQYAFRWSAIDSISFPELTAIQQYGLGEAFCYNTNYEGFNIEFPKLTEIDNYSFQNMLQYATPYISVHFRADVESKISGHVDIQNCMGNSEATIIYDL